MITLFGMLASAICAVLKLAGELHWTWPGVGAPFMFAMLTEALWRGDVLGWLIADDFLDNLTDHDFHDD